MFHIAFTPATIPTNALSAKGKSLIVAIGELLKTLDVLELDEWFVTNVLEAAKEAVDNLDLGKPAKGVWTDMGCEDDAFSIDIFCADDARYVKLDDDYLLVPHGAVGLAIGEHNHQEWLYEMPEVGEWLDVLLPESKYACDNCDFKCNSDSELDSIDDMDARLDPGGIVPDGQCPKCGALAYLTQRCEHTGMTRDELESICGTPAKPQITAIDREIKCGSCTLTALLNDGSTRKLFSFYIDELAFADSELIGLTEDEAHQLRHQRDVAYLRS